MEIKIISQKKDFLKLKERWNSLLLESGVANIFLTWEWVYNWWEVFKGEKDELLLLLGIKDAEICGIAPFYITNGYYRKISFLGSGIVCSEYLSFIVGEENRIPFLTSICEYLNNNSNIWDSLHLESLERDDKTVFFLKNYVNSKNWRLIKLKEHICFYLPLSSSLEELKKTMSQSLIKNMLYCKRKLSSKGKVELRELNCSNYKELWAGFDTVVSLHQKRWQNSESKIGGVFSNNKLLRFLRMITEEFHKNNWLSIYCLTFDSKPIAADYNFKFNKKIWGYIKGFDPFYKQYSPGSICFWESMQFYINDGYNEYDCLRGDETYKNRWTDRFRKEQDILIVKRGLKGILFLLSRLSFEFMKNFLEKACPHKVFSYIRATVFNKSR